MNLHGEMLAVIAKSLADRRSTGSRAGPERRADAAVLSRDDQSSGNTLHKLHLRLTKLSAASILMSSQRRDEILREGRSEKRGNIPNGGSLGFGFDFCGWLLLRLRCAGVALPQAISAIPSLCAL
ncbi:hypothetical protein IVA80_06005 [Bradyrhizobium sp. 139]|uniref:hypothetical protein n=1 Tax=Bradyrhizobium sp. 139 TaxID=2782616 RepID=UPI001FF76A56|nr:hypothetical protein [Bradyrhizobium sp. 139]MCK1740430.1 hypothetical protein [Bradyrhizobium sp. 139]